MEYFDIYIDYNKIEIIYDGGGFQSRHKSMISLITQSYNIYKNEYEKNKNKKVEVRIYTGDRFGDGISMAGTKKDYDNLIPAFVFDCWKEVGIYDYEEKINMISKAGEINYIYDKVFWVGNVTTHVTRKKLIEYGKSDKRTVFIDRRTISKDISLEDHTKYRVLIDIQGIGHSGRIPYLLATGRCVIIQERQVEQWYYWNDTLIPWVHYIPVKEDLSDLKKIIDWTFDNKDKCKTIGENGYKYVEKYLSKQKIYERINNVLTKHFVDKSELEYVLLQIKKDSNDFKYTDTTNVQMDIILQTDFLMKQNVIKIQIKNNKINILHEPTAYQRRGEGLIVLLEKILKKYTINDTILFIHIADEYIYKFTHLPFFVLAKPLDKKGLLTVDNTFVDYEPEAKTEIDNEKMKTIFDLKDKIEEKIEKIKKEDKIYFIGQNIGLKKTNFNLREYLSKQSYDFPLQIIVNGYQHMSEFINYKYLINLPGMSPWSFRFKFLFLMKTFVINVALRRKYGTSYDDKWINIFDQLFVPNEDYIELLYLYDEKENQSSNLTKLIKEIKGVYNKYNDDDKEYNKIVTSGYEKGKLLNYDNIIKIAYIIYDTYTNKIKNAIINKYKNKYVENAKQYYNRFDKSGEFDDVYYKIIGSGVQGIVYLVKQNDFEFIVKKTKLKISRFEPLRETFLGEMINNINKYHDFLYYYDFCVIDNYFYLSMEKGDGDLFEWTKTKHKTEIWKSMIFQILNSLKQLYTINIKHYDTQAKNIVYKKKKTIVEIKILNNKFKSECDYQFYIIDYGISAHPDLNINLISQEDLQNELFDLKRFSKLPDKIKSMNVKNKYSFNELIKKCEKIEQTDEKIKFNNLIEIIYHKLKKFIEKYDDKHNHLIKEFDDYCKTTNNLKEIKDKILYIFSLYPNDKIIHINKFNIVSIINKKMKKMDYKTKLNKLYKKTKDFENKNDYIHTSLAYYYVKCGNYVKEDRTGYYEPNKEIEYLFNLLKCLTSNIDTFIMQNY